MIHRAGSVLLIAALAVLGACSVDDNASDEDKSTTSTTRGTNSEDVRFLNVTHDDGTDYRCIWRRLGDAGGLWCERVTPPTTTGSGDTLFPFDD